MSIAKKRGKAMKSTDGLSVTGFLRLSAIVGKNGLIPISKSSWYAGIQAGRFPAPIRLGPRTSAWRTEDIRELIEQLGSN